MWKRSVQLPGNECAKSERKRRVFNYHQKVQKMFRRTHLELRKKFALPHPSPSPYPSPLLLRQEPYVYQTDGTHETRTKSSQPKTISTLKSKQQISATMLRPTTVGRKIGMQLSGCGSENPLSTKQDDQPQHSST